MRNPVTNREDSTHSEVELGTTNNASDNPLHHDNVDRGSLPSPSPSMSASNSKPLARESNTSTNVVLDFESVDGGAIALSIDGIPPSTVGEDESQRVESVDQIEINMDPAKPTMTVTRKSISTGTPPHTSSQDDSSQSGGNMSNPDGIKHRSKTASTTTRFRSSKFGSLLVQQFERIKDRITSPRSSFVFTDFSTKRFARIRNLCGISIEDYVQSFSSTTMPQFSEGKSGAFLYFSSDYKYIVKTTTSREFEKLLQILPSYECYLRKMYKRGNNSLLTRYLGAHRIIMYDIPLYFVVMKNVLGGDVGGSIDEKYDLKGSWVNRHGSKMNKAPEFARPKKNYHMVRSSLLLHSSSMYNGQGNYIGATSAAAGTGTSMLFYTGGTGDVLGSAQSSIDGGDSTSKGHKAILDEAVQQGNIEKDGKTPNSSTKKKESKKESTPLFLDNDVQNSFIIHPEDAITVAKQIQRDIKFLEGELIVRSVLP